MPTDEAQFHSHSIKSLRCYIFIPNKFLIFSLILYTCQQLLHHLVVFLNVKKFISLSFDFISVIVQFLFFLDKAN